MEVMALVVKCGDVKRGDVELVYFGSTPVRADFCFFYHLIFFMDLMFIYPKYYLLFFQ